MALGTLDLEHARFQTSFDASGYCDHKKINAKHTKVERAVDE